MNPIGPIKELSIKPLETGGDTTQVDRGFADQLKQAIRETNHLEHVANDSIEQVINGNMGIHEGMLAVQEADLSMRLLLKVRGKVMQAYQEIMRMPV